MLVKAPGETRRACNQLLMTVDPFPRDESRPLVVHVRTHVLSDRKAPFLLKTILGLRPYFRNVVITPGIDCQVPADLHVERVQLKTLRDPIARFEIARRRARRR